MQVTQPSDRRVPPAPDEARVSEAVRSKLPFRAELAGLVPLTGDASNRRYFRVQLGPQPPRSVILMQLAEPEAFKQSEEAVSGPVASEGELPFVNVLRHLARAGVTVPTLYYHDQEAGLLYLEDFGDVTLAEIAPTMGAAERAALYRSAIDMLVRLHTKATSPANPRCIAFRRGFDASLLMWEFDHFLEYGVVARNGTSPRAEDLTVIRTEFQRLAELLAGQPRVFTHRDYHARNLMIDGPRVGVLDFQDALLGPAPYDLASLLRDAYVELEEGLVEELIAYYQERVARHRPVTAVQTGFRRLFDLTSLQRNLKAAGRFVYIDRVKQNPKFLSDIPRTLGYVRRNLARYPELATLRTVLAKYVPELQ